MVCHSDFLNRLSKLLLFGLILFLLPKISLAQHLPKKIRGYKVHHAKVLIESHDRRSSTDKGIVIIVDVGKPNVSGVSFFGFTIEISPKITILKKSGKIDFITFKNINVNGIKLRLDEYNQKFTFKKSKAFELQPPLKAFLSTSQSIRVSFNELLNSKRGWNITGKVFVFGRFKKSFLKFKRVIPVDLNFTIRNPIRNQSR